MRRFISFQMIMLNQDIRLYRGVACTFKICYLVRACMCVMPVHLIYSRLMEMH